MGKKKGKQKKTASGRKQSFFFEPLILGHICKGNCDYIFDEQKKVMEALLDAIF